MSVTLDFKSSRKDNFMTSLRYFNCMAGPAIGKQTHLEVLLPPGQQPQLYSPAESGQASNY